MADPADSTVASQPSNGQSNANEMASVQRQSSTEDGRPRSVSTGSGPRSRSTSFCAGRVVVLAIDASDHAKNAFEFYETQVHRSDDLIILVHCPETPKLPTITFKNYIENIKKPDDVLVLSHIPEAPKLPSFTFKSGIAPPVEEWKKVIDDMNSRTRKLEEDYEGTCIQKKLRYKVRGEAYKNPGEGICRIADEEGASLIIMGTRGLNAVKRALLGSVSEYVCRHSGIPTLIVPAPGRRRSKSRGGSISEQQPQK